MGGAVVVHVFAFAHGARIRPRKRQRASDGGKIKGKCRQSRSKAENKYATEIICLRNKYSSWKWHLIM